MNVGATLRKARRAAGLTQTERWPAGTNLDIGWSVAQALWCA